MPRILDRFSDLEWDGPNLVRREPPSELHAWFRPFLHAQNDAQINAEGHQEDRATTNGLVSVQRSSEATAEASKG